MVQFKISRRTLSYLAWVSCGIVVISFLLSCFDVTKRYELKPEHIAHLDGKALYANVPDSFWLRIFGPQSDSNQNPNRSDMKLFADFVELQPHQMHQELVSGVPGFSHWGGEVIFSTGNVEKEKPSKVFLELPIRIPFLIVILSICIMVTTFNISPPASVRRVLDYAHLRAGGGGYLLLISASLILIFHVIYFYPELPVVSLDGLGYIAWGPKVPVGYPIFVTVIAKFFLSLKAVVVAQVALFCIATVVVYQQLRIATNQEVLPLFTALVMLGAGRIMNYNLTISTDGLFATLIVFYFACVISILKNSSAVAMFAIGLVTVVTIFVRPAGFFLMGGLVLLFILMQGGRVRFVKWAGAAVLISYVAFSALTHATTNTQTSRSILGLALMPHVVHLLTIENIVDNEPELLEIVYKESGSYRKKMNDLLQSSWSDAYRLEADNFNKITADINNSLWKYFSLGQKDLSGSEDELRATKVRLTLEVYENIAKRVILNNPLGYLEIVAVNFVAAYKENTLIVEPPGYAFLEGAPFSWWLEETRPNARKGLKILGLHGADADESLMQYSFMQSKAFTYLDLLHYAGNWASIVLTFSAIYLVASLLFLKKKDILAILGGVALMLHLGATLLVCLTTVAIPRYSVPIDILLIISTGCAMCLVAAHLKSLFARVSIVVV